MSSATKSARSFPAVLARSIGEVLVRVESSSLNGFDTAVAAGYLAGMMEHRFPVVLGKDFAGTVEAIGDGVTRFAAGDRVFGVVTKAFLGDGGFGEFVTVSEAIGIAKLPVELDATVAGALGLAGTAAVDALDAVAPQSGETVLISGATGGVGAIAIQYAAAAGAKVIATARPGAEADFVRGLGATDVVDHTGDLAAQVRAITPGGVDVVLHLAGDGAALTALLTDKGRLASTLGLGPDQHPAATAVMATPTADTLDRLAADAAAGRLTVPVSRTYALHEVPAAFGDFTLGTIGKLAITLA
ncbi:zinc-binding dehydrogenase [Micromonospora sp. NBC_01699]|uniref:alcohol dehydrogenase catalytic domain-containing protein n=1 Tax=Micromonospora sp. NBC_01699 TaxID=2975984 RepID=UPI002E2D244B|nr:zinc-binding dehydrogenase [Micromonospora sp. NBC_01699]